MNKFMRILIYGMIITLVFSFISCSWDDFLDQLDKKNIITMSGEGRIAFKNEDSHGGVYYVTVTKAPFVSEKQRVVFSADAFLVGTGGHVEFSLYWAQEVDIGNQDTRYIDYRDYDKPTTVGVTIYKIISSSSKVVVAKTFIKLDRADFYFCTYDGTALSVDKNKERIPPVTFY